jgi:hypothetical protein
MTLSYNHDPNNKSTGEKSTINPLQSQEIRIKVGAINSARLITAGPFSLWENSIRYCGILQIETLRTFKKGGGCHGQWNR